MGNVSEKIEGIVTSVIKYSERHNIVVLYTPTYGRMTFLSPAASSKKGQARNARLLPLSLIEAEVRIDRNKEVQNLGRFSLLRIWHGIYGNAEKSAIALFLSEFLNCLLRDSPPDKGLWQTITEGLQILNDKEDDVWSSHIEFVASLLAPMGILPDATDFAPDKCFDMRDGKYQQIHPLHADVLAGKDAFIPLLWCDLARRIEVDVKEYGRRKTLDLLLRYFSIHYPGLDKLKSLDVLHQVFS